MMFHKSWFDVFRNLWVFGILSVMATWSFASNSAKPPDSQALLVGCTVYPNHAGLRELYGPANDVPMWMTLLTDPKGFAFPQERVTQLVGWPDDEARRPTFANIVKGFESLIANAQPDSRVVIVMSGHGVQVPIPPSQKDPLDPKNPEPDGLDEIFLPADVKEWTDDGLQNAIADNQVGEWLDRLREKGAHVLIVFDCCHSGTMTRGGPDVREISRSGNPAALGIKDDTIRDAVTRAKQAVAKAKAEGKLIPGEATVKSSAKPQRGSLVAFYAAQPYEEAPELPFPEDAPILKENYYGALSYALVQAIRNRQSPLSYDELQRLVGASYRSSRGARPPSPFAEGDVNREVLGMTVWPNRPSLLVERDKKKRLTLRGGTLHGLTKGSILALLPPPGDERDPKTVIGYVNVESITPTAASIVPTKLDANSSQPPIAVNEVPDLARCEIVRRDFGDMRVKLFQNAAPVKAALDQMGSGVGDLVNLVPDEAQADWRLLVVTPAVAEKEYGIRGMKADHVLLVQGEGQARLSDDKSPEQPAASGLQRFKKVFGQYPLSVEKGLVGALELDLPKIFKWENLWRVAGGVSADSGGETFGLSISISRLKDEDDTVGELVQDGKLHDEDEVVFRAKNSSGEHDLWVTAFYLEANLGIQVLFNGGVGRGREIKLGQGTMTTKGQSAGREGLVVFAIPQSVQKTPQNFSLLEQQPLRVTENLKGQENTRGPTTPFGNLLRQASANSGTRAMETRASSTPAILTQSWVLVP